MLKSEFDCTFFTVSPTEYQVGEMTKVCNYAALNTDTALSEFLDLLKGDEIVVLDNYFYTDDYFRSILQKAVNWSLLDQCRTGTMMWICLFMVSHKMISSLRRQKGQSYTMVLIMPSLEENF